MRKPNYVIDHINRLKGPIIWPYGQLRRGKSHSLYE